MSRTIAKVKFPDGDIKYGIYNGTTDFFWQPLFCSPQEAWDSWKIYYQTPQKEGKPDVNDKYLHEIMKYRLRMKIFYPVEIANEYGGVSFYKGMATKNYIHEDYLEESNLKQNKFWWDEDLTTKNS